MQPPGCFCSLASDNPPAWLLELERKQGPPPQRSKGYGWAGHRRLPEGRGLHLGLERGIWIIERKREAFPVSGAVEIWRGKSTQHIQGQWEHLSKRRDAWGAGVPKVKPVAPLSQVWLVGPPVPLPSSPTPWWGLGQARC